MSGDSNSRDSPFPQPALQDEEGGLFGIKTYPGEIADASSGREVSASGDAVVASSTSRSGTYGGKQKWLVTAGRAVTGSIIRAHSAEEAAKLAFGRKKLSGMPGGIEMGQCNFVTVYPLSYGQEFYPVIEYELTGVREKP